MLDRDDLKRMRGSILAAAIFLVFFAPPLMTMRDGLLSWGWSMLLRFQDSLYAAASVGDIGERSSGIILFLVFVLVIERRASGVASLFMGPGWDDPISPRAQRVFQWVFGVLFTLLFLTFAWLGLVSAVSVRLNISFDSRLANLAPALNETEEERFRADWDQMRRRLDYLAINVRMDSVAVARGVKIPRPTLN
jgi:hypothetical protein